MNRIKSSILATAVLIAALATPAIAANKMFKATLKGSEEVPARQTNASGHAAFSVSADQNTIDYRVTLGSIDNVTTVGLYAGAVGATGDAVAILFGPAAPGGGKANGMLAKGTLTAASLTGPLAGKTIADLVTEIEAGRIYVNVLTDDGSSSTNERPGDFATGEIRGQVN